MQKSKSLSLDQAFCVSGLEIVLVHTDFLASFDRTNDATSHSFVSLTLGVLDANGNVVATGAGIISNLQPYETKIFDASAIYSGTFDRCQIQIDYQLP